MTLSDLFSGGQLKNASAQSTVTQRPDAQSVQNRADQSALINRQIQSLKPGQTLQGEVISRDGNQVQIKVNDDFVLEAKMDRDMNIQVGRTMTFEVRNNGQSLTLSPLFANMATQENAMKALEMSSLPINQTTVSMTGLMMEAGLSVDRNSLQQMFREINTFTGANISDVVDLHKLGLAVNEENLTQIGSYKNLTHQLVEGLHTVLETLPEGMENMVADGHVEGAAQMFQDLLGMIGELQGEEGAEQSAAGLTDPEGMAQVREAAAAEGRTYAAETLGSQEHPEAAAAQGASNGGGETAGQAAQASTGMSTAMANELMQLVQSSAGENNSYGPLLEQLTQAVNGGSVTEQAKVLQQILEQGLQDKNQPLLEGLLANKGAQKLLSDGLSRLWTIEPKDVADPGKVEELYSRLNRQLGQLNRMLEDNGQSQSKAFQAVNNMSRNIDFLQQLNQAYTYVQLPLRLQQGDAHGDLYVYTNKRNLAAKDGQISALLHLDMENLGPVDVYVAMQGEKVNTRFYVQDDEMLDFLEGHMDLLTARLQKRGYHCDFAMQVRDSGKEPSSGIKGLMAEAHARPIAQYAFDVRA